MKFISIFKSNILLSLGVLSLIVSVAWAGGFQRLVKISEDPYTDPAFEHATEVDPSQAAFGNTIVTAFQVARAYGAGGLNIGWSTSLDGGRSWEHGFLEGTTPDVGGPWAAVTLPVVTYDLKHNTWLIMITPFDNTDTEVGLIVSRSLDGLHWSKPTTLYSAISGEATDKYWAACDNNRFSQYFGNCYAAWFDYDPILGYGIKMSKSRDGGSTWSVPIDSTDNDGGSVGSVVIQPNGKVVVIATYGGTDGTYDFAVESADGGKTFEPSVNFATLQFNYPAQGYMRADPFPTAGVGPDGTIYAVYSDCSFRANCTANDLVLTTSKNGQVWTPFQRIPIDSVTSNVDHFIPGLAVRNDFPCNDNKNTGLALSYYYLSNALCDPTTTQCHLFAGTITSNNGGKTWSEPTQASGPMQLTWLASTFAGYMVANEMTSVYVNGIPQTAFAIGIPNNQKTGKLDEAIYSFGF